LIAIIDYGVGNLASVQNAFRRVGYPSLVTDQPEQILGAEKVVLPGVGAFADGMTTLRKKGLTDVLYEVVEKEIPLLGICLGMQMLFSTSEEEGLHQGLDLIPEGFGVFRYLVRIKCPIWAGTRSGLLCPVDYSGMFLLIAMYILYTLFIPSLRTAR
jgi:imidazole glycerol phosphate synthase glutamine amidotransferase subunit